MEGPERNGFRTNLLRTVVLSAELFKGARVSRPRIIYARDWPDLLTGALLSRGS